MSNNNDRDKGQVLIVELGDASPMCMQSGSLLSRSIKADNEEAFLLLIERKCSLLDQTNSYCPALYTAIERGSVKFVNHLLNFKPEIARMGMVRYGEQAGKYCANNDCAVLT
jgi:hypothetical protein